MACDDWGDGIDTLQLAITQAEQSVIRASSHSTEEPPMLEEWVKMCEMYTAPNSHLLSYMKSEEFDPYKHWYEVCDIMDQEGELGQLGVETLDQAQDLSPETWNQLDQYMKDRVSEQVYQHLHQHAPEDLPTHQMMSLVRQKLIKRTTWLAHFTDYADEIQSKGFCHGIDRPDELGLIGAGMPYSIDDAKRSFESILPKWKSLSRQYHSSLWSEPEGPVPTVESFAQTCESRLRWTPCNVERQTQPEKCEVGGYTCIIYTFTHASGNQFGWVVYRGRPERDGQWLPVLVFYDVKDGKFNHHHSIIIGFTTIDQAKQDFESIVPKLNSLVKQAGLEDCVSDGIEPPMVESVSEITALVPEIVVAAQAVYDDWQQDQDGNDEQYGSGGICDQINQEICGILSGAGFDVTDGGQDGDDHAYCYAGKAGKAWIVDIPASIYEVGSGYSWKKRPDVTITAEDVVIEPVRYDDVFGDEPSDNQVYQDECES